MNDLIVFEGTVLFVTDDTRSFPVKDKDGVPTSQMKDHRITKIQMLVKTPSGAQAAVNVNGFDLPPTFKLPKSGDKFSTPITRFEIKNGFPEAGI